MGAPEAPTAGRATTGAGQLHTPHETAYDSFTQDTTDNKQDGPVLPPVQTLSPPVSPETLVYPNFRAINAQLDPPLYADNTGRNPQQEQASLFDAEYDSQSKSHPSSRHDSQQSDSPKSDAREVASRGTDQQPTGQKLPNLLGFLGAGASYVPATKENVMDYMQKRMAELEVLAAYRRARLPSPTRSQAVPRHPEDNRQLRTLDKPAGVRKNKSPPKAAARRALPRPVAVVAAASPEPPAAAPASRRSRTPRTKNLDEFHDEAFPGTEKKHKRAAPSKTTAAKDEDNFWREMEDFAPPLDTAEKPLKVTWSGQPLNITNEADFDALSDEEKDLCTTLRLKPAQYLSNKRRIFKARLQYLKEDNKNFTRTAAQGSTNIDVNKASQLWLAFDRCGWFEKKHYEKWL